MNIINKANTFLVIMLATLILSACNSNSINQETYNTTRNSKFLTESDVSGSLTPLSPATINIPSTYSIAFTPNSKYAYVIGSANFINMYRIGSDGILYPRSTPTINTPEKRSIAITPNGEYLYAADYYSNQVYMFSIGVNGILYPLPTSTITSTSPGHIVITPDSKYAYVEGETSVSMYSINNSGVLSPLPITTLNTNGYIQDIAITPNDKYVYIASSGQVNTYTIESNGELTFLATPTTNIGNGRLSVAFTNNSKYAYVTNTKTNAIYMYSIGNDGILAPLTTPSISTSSPTKIEITDKYAYVMNYNTSRISMYSISDNGVLLPLTSPTVITGSGVEDIGITPNFKYLYTTGAFTKAKAIFMYGITASRTDFKALTAFSLNGIAGTIIGQNISVTLPYGASVNNLIATFTTSGETVKIGNIIQTSGITANNFTNPVNYTVIASDGSTNTYTVTVTIAGNPANAMTAFSLSGTPGTIVGQNISVTLPYGTDVKSLIATFMTNGEMVKVGSITQISGTTPNDFTNPVAYTVTAADGSSNNYTVLVTVAGIPANTITAFALNGTPGTITDKNIAVTMPFGTSLTALIATFTTTGQSVNIGGIPQVSGNTPNNFTSPIIYTVVAANGSTNTYTVTVTIAGSPANAITAFALNGTPGNIVGQNITISMPFATNLTALIATFSTTGQTVSVGGITQVSGTTPNDFTKPVTYTVVAANGNINTYNLTVSTETLPLFSCVADGSNQCGCLTQNDNSNLMWYADGSMNGKWSDWCSTTSGNCVVTGSKLASFNAANHCGHNDWHLPSVTNSSDNSYISQAGGEWGTLATYAKNNGFKNGQPLYVWLNNNRFKGIQSGTYWSSFSYNTNYVWDVVMYKERVSYDYTGPTIWGVLLVRDGK